MAMDHCMMTTTRYGWLSIFMHTLNETWPHPDHMLFNLGIPGHSYHNFAHDACIEPYLPDSVDLLILEHLPYLEPASSPGGTMASAEVLMHRLQVKLKMPSGAFIPTIFLNMHRLKDRLEPDFEAVAKCISTIQPAMALYSTGSLCDTECPTQFADLPPAGGENAPAEVETNLLAARHDMVSLSYAKVRSLFCID